MEPKIFIIKDGRPAPSEFFYTIPAFVNLEDEYEVNVGKICCVIHYLNSLNPETNPYAHIDEDKKADQIYNEICPELNLDTEAFKMAYIKAKEMYDTGPKKVFLAFKRLMEKLVTQIDLVNVDLTKDTGNMTQITAAIKNYKALEESYNSSFEKYISSLSASKTKAGAKKAYDDDLDDEEDDDDE